jgi:ribosomal protein S18 acetylase RimI-like enzyme
MPRLKKNVSIRPMTLEDYPQVLDLWNASPGMGLSAADSRERIDTYLQRNPRMSLVAHTGPAIVGAVLCGHDGRRGFIHHLAVAESHRHRGIGKSLVDECLKELRASGIDKCHIFVYASNEEALAFWKHSGWTQRHELIILSKDIPLGP